MAMVRVQVLRVVASSAVGKTEVRGQFQFHLPAPRSSTSKRPHYVQPRQMLCIHHNLLRLHSERLLGKTVVIYEVVSG